jgi:DNA topoisomerase I
MSQVPVGQVNNPVASAQIVGLRYVADGMPGIRRENSGHGFRYRYPTGDVVQDEAVLGRIKSLAIPPAWTEVWICPDPSGHLQATGRDERGRKQSRYHPRWREVRDETKYARMLAFGKVLPKIRKRVAQHLALPGLPRNKVLATVVRLLEVSHIRVGNQEYARENESFGLTTMRNRHVQVNGSTLRFRFRGKSSKWHEVDIHDARLARIVRRCQDLPGQELFQYLDEYGERKDVTSEDVNIYLRQISGEDFTAKDFRTWAGTVLTALALRDFKNFGRQREARKNIVKAIETVADHLGNTPAVCRKCYVHPEVLHAYQEGTLARTLQNRAEKEVAASRHQLRPEEAAVLRLLQREPTEENRLNRQLKASLNLRRRGSGRLRL